MVQEGCLMTFGRRVRIAVRRWLDDPAPSDERLRAGADRARDAWILRGPRWH
jgi:hypothetical protein